VRSAIVKGMLYLYVFWLPFESPVRTMPYDVTTLLGFAFIVASFLTPRACYGRIPGAIWWFGAYLYLCGLVFALGTGDYVLEVREYVLRVGQLLVIFWASANLMRDERTARMALYALILACVGLAAMQLTGIASISDFAWPVHRVTVLGQHPNRTARLLAAGVLALIGLAYGRPQPALRPRMMIWPAVAMLGFAMVQGGSRGALLALCLGLWTFTLVGGRMSTRIKGAALSMTAIVFLGWMAMQSPVMRKRFEMAEAGNLAKREEIFPTALQLFREKPLLGWGPIANQYEVARRLPMHVDNRRDTHNLLLEVLTASGLVGTTFFVIGFGLCALAAWRARTGPAGVLPLAMFATLFVGNMSGNFLTFKVYWVMLAFAVGSAALVPRRIVAGARFSHSHSLGSAPARVWRTHNIRRT
jgi:O-antigen ligase